MSNIDNSNSFYPSNTPNTLYICVDEEIDLSLVLKYISNHFPGVSFKDLTVVNSRLLVSMGNMKTPMDFLVVHRLTGMKSYPETYPSDMDFYSKSLAKSIQLFELNT